MAMLEQDGGTGAHDVVEGGEVADAARRLDDALARLEALVARRAAREGDLQVALEAARGENAEMKALLARLAERVDLAVGRLEEVLEE